MPDILNELLPEPNQEPDDQLRSLMHDLRNSVSAVNFTAHFLALKALPTAEREQYTDVFARNLAKTALLVGLLADGSSPVTTAAQLTGNDPTDILRRVYSQLPSSAPTGFQEQLDQIRQMIEAFL